MNAPADFQHDAAAGALRFSGNLSLRDIGDLPDRLSTVEGDVRVLDMRGIDRIDTVGAWVIHRFARDHGAQVSGLDSNQQLLFDHVAQADHPIAGPRKPMGAFAQLLAEIGEAVIQAGKTMWGLLGFMGATAVAAGRVIANPRRFRYHATVHRFEVVGVSALGIIGLMSFLIGIVIAQQGAVQLRQFGAEVFTINLIGRITLRELGVLMTAIMVAGRSGSAFAAQLGTMKLTEEVDAMRTIGISPIEALVIPRILAAVVMMPLLGFFASCIAIVGGAVIGDLMLGIPFFTFLSRIQEVVPLYDLYVGLAKAPVFGLIVALTGCYQGLQVQGNSEQVGLKTTKAVVQAIFMVIVLDAFFAVFFTEIGWG